MYPSLMYSFPDGTQLWFEYTQVTDELFSKSWFIALFLFARTCTHKSTLVRGSGGGGRLAPVPTRTRAINYHLDGWRPRGGGGIAPPPPCPGQVLLQRRRSTWIGWRREGGPAARAPSVSGARDEARAREQRIVTTTHSLTPTDPRLAVERCGGQRREERKEGLDSVSLSVSVGTCDFFF